jgi:hypothetical protein
VGVVLRPGTEIATSAVRSAMKLIMEPATPETIIMIEQGSLISVDELFGARDPNGKGVIVVRLGLAYGAVRAGVAESETRSDMEIRSPVATLAKRGTWDFRFFVESGTGNFQISLAERGLVQAIQNATGQRVTIQPGQFVNQAMSRWIETMRFSRPVNVQDWYGLKGAELVFNLNYQTGLGVVNPGGNVTNLLNVSTKQAQDLLAQLLRQQFGNLLGGGLGGPGTGLTQNPIDLRLFGPRRRPEGDFGVGQGAIPVFLGATSKLVQKGYAQPGRLDVWRPDAQNLLKNSGGHGPQK